MHPSSQVFTSAMPSQAPAPGPPASASSVWAAWNRRILRRSRVLSTAAARREQVTARAARKAAQKTAWVMTAAAGKVHSVHPPPPVAGSKASSAAIESPLPPLLLLPHCSGVPSQ